MVESAEYADTLYWVKASTPEEITELIVQYSSRFDQLTDGYLDGLENINRLNVRLTETIIALKRVYDEIKQKGDAWNDSHSCSDMWNVIKNIVERYYGN